MQDHTNVLREYFKFGSNLPLSLRWTDDIGGQSDYLAYALVDKEEIRIGVWADTHLNGSLNDC